MIRKNQRLPREYYLSLNVAFTLCTNLRSRFFVTADRVNPFIEKLETACSKHDCACVYCFMPEHLHLVMMSRAETADPLRAVEYFKQITGYWFQHNSVSVKWQPSFYDEIVRSPRELKHQIYYVVNNPVRRGLVEDWDTYPFTGAIACDLRQLLSDISCA